MSRLIGICGSDDSNGPHMAAALQIAEHVGGLIARNHGILICGGRGGVMRAACKGAKAEGGVTVGILPRSKDEANEYVDIPLPTYLGHLRNAIVVSASDVVIAIGGRWGTLNEISYAMSTSKPLVLIKGTGGCVDEIIEGRIMQHVESTYHVAHSADEAIDIVLSLLDDDTHKH
jgi:uncharacterized protein (TIGR00725 family)